jgi:hypothetical protein
MYFVIHLILHGFVIFNFRIAFMKKLLVKVASLKLNELIAEIRPISIVDNVATQAKLMMALVMGMVRLRLLTLAKVNNLYLGLYCLLV